MATVTKGRTFVSGETVTPTKLNELVDLATVTSIVDADVSASAAIAASKLSTAAQQALLPAGAVMPFAMNSAPAGWLAADGTAVSRSTYATLFAATSTTHGVGDGSTTFNLPDLRGIFVRGSGSQTISGTAYSGTFAAKQQDEFKQHVHSTTAGGSNGPMALFSGNGPAAQSATTNSGTAGGDETRPANIALLYCIKF